ncbi:adenine deaminase, partial [Candidatus Bipolaricaulota bacterium]
PSCVPAAPDLETTGAAIGPSEVAEALTWDNVIGLGEVMNYPGVAAGDETLHAEIAEALKVGKTVGGHYASSDLASPFHAYAAGGPSDCHEGTQPEDVVARVRQGMYSILRQGSSEHNVVEQVKAITEGNLSPRHVLLCTDDRHSDTLLRIGHIDDVVRLAMVEGVPVMTAIQMATLNTAEHFGVAGDVGSLAPGRFADILIVSDLNSLTIDRVFAAGESVAENGTLTVLTKPFPYPESAKNSIKIPRGLTTEDFVIPASAFSSQSSVRCRVIETIENQVLTRRSLEEIPIADGCLRPSLDSGISFLAVVERHTGRMGIGRGLVKGYGLTRPYGLASTVAHDSHNLIVMGTDPGLMAAAANHVASLSGGICLMGRDGLLAEIPLPIAGLMSEDPVATIAGQTDRLHHELQELGCAVQDALMSYFFLALPVIPDLRLTDLGLVDVNAFEIVPLIAEGDNPNTEER